MKVLNQLLGYVHLELERREAGRETGEALTRAGAVRPVRGDMLAEGRAACM